MARVKLLDPTDARRRLDRYELIGEIASGGMATVFLGRLGGVGGFQRFVAIKRLHPHLAGEPEFVEMFLDEARLAAGIHHPNVVPILEVGTTDAGYYLVMEYVEGDTLARLVARALSKDRTGHVPEPLPRPILLRIVLDALAGLHAAHELCDQNGQLLGLVHRDVSPQNVLVGVDGSSRLTDFGVARATARLSNTRAGQLKGKLAYMAPEQTRGTPFDRRADLFSMGIVLWELLTGQRLFKMDSEAATLSRILLDPIQPPSRVGANVPPVFDNVCARALARDPAQRYQTAAEMGEGLERASIAAARPSEVPVASPRDIAAYVQRVLGHEISQQRESVRAWLAQSEPSLVGIPAAARSADGASREVTGKYALDTSRPLVDSVTRAPATERSAGVPDVPPEAISDDPTPAPATARGVGPSAGPPAPPPAEERAPSSGRTLPGVPFPTATPLQPPPAPPPPPRVVPNSPPIPTLMVPAVPPAGPLATPPAPVAVVLASSLPAGGRAAPSAPPLPARSGGEATARSASPVGAAGWNTASPPLAPPPPPGIPPAPATLPTAVAPPHNAAPPLPFATEDGEPTAVRGSMTLPQSPPQLAMPVEQAPLSVPQGPPMKSRAPIVLALLVLFGAAAVTVFWIRRPTDTSSSSGGPPAVTATTAATPITPTTAAAPSGTATAEPEPAGIPVSSLPSAPPEPKAGRGGPAVKKGEPTPAETASSKAGKGPREQPPEDLANPYR